MPTLVVRCQTPLKAEKFPDFMPFQPGLEVYIVTGMPANVENGEGLHQIFVRFDDEKAQQWGSRESTDEKALFIAPAYATRIVVSHHTLADSKRMLVQFTPFNASQVLITFDTRGFDRYVDQVLDACPPVD